MYMAIIRGSIDTLHKWNTNAYTSLHNKLGAPFAHSVPKPYLTVRKLKIFFSQLSWSLNTSAPNKIIKYVPLKFRITNQEAQIVGDHAKW
jgi:hypothetical protein